MSNPKRKEDAVREELRSRTLFHLDKNRTLQFHYRHYKFCSVRCVRKDDQESYILILSSLCFIPFCFPFISLYSLSRSRSGVVVFRFLLSFYSVSSCSRISCLSFGCCLTSNTALSCLSNPTALPCVQTA